MSELNGMERRYAELGIGDGLIDVRYREARERMIGWAEDWLGAMSEQMSMEKAGDMLRAFHLRANLHEDGKWISRFLLGEATRRVRAETEHGKITELMRGVADRFQININTLRYSVGVAAAFDGNIRQFDRWLVSGGYQKRWKHIKAITRLKTDVTELGAEELADEVIRMVEGAAEEIERINDTLDPEQREALSGASLRFGEEAARFRDRSWQALEDAEAGPTAALQAFDQMIRNMECAGCKCWPEEGAEVVKLDPHHVGTSATAKKRNEWCKIPLCRSCHSLLHNGIGKFTEETGVSVTKAVAETLYFFIARGPVHWPPGVT